MLAPTFKPNSTKGGGYQWTCTKSGIIDSPLRWNISNLDSQIAVNPKTQVNDQYTSVNFSRSPLIIRQRKVEICLGRDVRDGGVVIRF